ncbi:MAG: GAD domain-containing protein [Elusimicrobiota bacterium]
MVKDITTLLKNTESHLLKNIIHAGGVVLGVKIKGKTGVLVKDEEFSDRLQAEVAKKTGVGGFISTDELPRYGISAKEKAEIEKDFNCLKKDVIVFVAADKEKAEKAIQIIENEMTKRVEVKRERKKKIAKTKKTSKKIKSKKKK